MKTTPLKTAIALFSLLMLLTSGSTLFAQEVENSPIMNQLSLQQKEMLQTQRQIMLKNREHLKASLTEQQLAILQDKTQTKDQMRMRLRETFNDAQNQMVRGQERQLRQLRDQFRESCTQEQRKMLQEHMQQTRQSSGQGEMRNGDGFGSHGDMGDRTRSNDGTRMGSGNGNHKGGN